jgi:AraC-like DNA-binding protein
MSKIDVVRTMQVFIEDNLYKKITLNDLSLITNYSPWHCYRLFTETIGMSVGQYIRKYKLSKSALELRDDNVKIIDIAYKYGFDNVDGYQRAFNKEFNINPYEYSKNPKPIYLFTPYKKYEERKYEMKELQTVFITKIVKPRRKVIIKRGIKANHYFDYCEEVGCDVWGLLTSIPSISGEPVCLWLPKTYVIPNTSTYVQGVEVDLNYDGKIPEGFEIIELPEATYLMFNGAPFKEEDYGKAIENVWKAIEEYNPNVLGLSWDDENPRIQLEPIGDRGYIELKAVK